LHLDFIVCISHLSIYLKNSSLLSRNIQKCLLIVINLKYFFFYHTNVIISHVYVILFSPPPTCHVRAIALFCRYFLFARTVDLRPVVTDIYIFAYIYNTRPSIFLVLPSGHLRNREKENDRICVCVRTVDSSVCSTVLFTHSFFLQREKNTNKKKKIETRKRSADLGCTCAHTLFEPIAILDKLILFFR